jgi:hypothetical protein
MAGLVWELIDDEWGHPAGPEGYTYRAKVTGGWLVSVWAGDEKKHGLGGGITFMPDPLHEWKVDLRPTKAPR